MRRTLRTIGLMTLAGLLMLSSPAVSLAGEDSEFEGLVELLYRNVSQDGSAAKYDEDFDALDSGLRLGKLTANWYDIDSGLLDFLRLDANGIGGDPYERAALRLGRKDVYELNLTHWKQSYMYNLFESVDDLDGHSWDSKRKKTDFDLTWHATKSIDLFLEMQNVRRNGTSLFMKDINADLFRLETPLDQDIKRYTLGGRFEVGRADILFRQTLRRSDYRFNNMTSADTGLSTTDLATLDSYDWRQSDRGDADMTTLTLNLPFSERFHLTASAHGTLLGEERISSHVTLNAEGTSFRGTCSVSGATCDENMPCDIGIPGNFCVTDPFSVVGGMSDAEIEADHLLLDADLSVNIIEPLDFHLQVRSLDREIRSSHLRDLDGNGVPDDTEGSVNDDTPGSVTNVDYTLQSITGLFDYAPSSKIRIRAGYRTVDRDMTRSGFEYGASGNRNSDFESNSDDTIILGLMVKPRTWLRLSADYEQDDIEQAFTAVAPMEVDRLRVRARFTPGSDMRVDLSYLDYENKNHGADFRQDGSCPVPGGDIDDGCWSSSGEGNSLSASFWHKANQKLDYWFRWAQQDFDRVVRVRYDLDPFGIAENGDSSYAIDSTEWAGHVNLNWAKQWKGFLRLRVNDASGANDLAGTLYTNSLMIGQDFSDLEAGVTYTFPRGLYLGGRYRIFDYDDLNDRMDYDGDIFTLIAGFSF